jgi:hypothetical protein
LETFDERGSNAGNDQESILLMGFLNLFSAKPTPATLLRLPTGSFTVDREGAVLVGTLPSSFPNELVREIASVVLSTFRDANEAQMPLVEVIVHYPSLRISARELRGGAIIYLSPKVPLSTATTK